MVFHDSFLQAVFGRKINNAPGYIGVNNSTATQLSETPTKGSRILIRPRPEVSTFSIYVGGPNVGTGTNCLEIVSTDGVVELPFGDASEIYVMGDGNHDVTFWVL